MCNSLPAYHDSLVLYAEFLHPGSVQLPQQTHDAGLLPRARWTIYQQVWKVATLDLKQTQKGKTLLTLPLAAILL